MFEFRRSTHLLFMISWCTFHSLEGFAQRVPLSSIRCNKGWENHKLKYVKREENLSLSILKGLLLKMLRRNTPYGNIIYMLIQLKVTRKWPEDLLSYRFILTKQIYEKGTTFQWKIPYTKEVPFVKNNLYKGKGLDLEVKPLRTKLYWVASHPFPCLLYTSDAADERLV